ncbi:MAG: M48 family metalloprotease [Hyphomonadaceae bacterium]|nr:M48 family metalloprotease [Hyphomonadaceae bacterium]
MPTKRRDTKRPGLKTLAAAAVAALMAMAAPAHALTVIRDAEIEEVLRSYTDPIFKAANLEPSEIEVILIQDTSINAFVTNSRTMFVHTGLITAAANPNEIKGVLAHETGHLAGGHVLRSRQAAANAMRPAFISIGLGILAVAAGAPGAGAALIAGSQQFAMADYVQFSQAQESQADQAAITYLEASGQSGEGLVTFASRQFRYNEMRSAQRIPPWMRTHPLWSDRIQALRNRVERSEHVAVTDSPADLAELKLIQAKLFGYTENAGRTLLKYPETDASAAARYARAVAAMRASDFAKADANAESLRREFPDNPYYHELAGEILLTSNRLPEAAAAHRRALELKPRNALLQINLARALLAQGAAHTDEAVRLLQAATATEPDNATAWYELARAHDSRGEEGLARLASAELRFSIGDWPAARSFAERAKERLERGTISYQRALDIATIAETRVREGRRG